MKFEADITEGEYLGGALILIFIVLVSCGIFAMYLDHQKELVELEAKVQQHEEKSQQ